MRFIGVSRLDWIGENMCFHEMYFWRPFRDIEGGEWFVVCWWTRVWYAGFVRFSFFLGETSFFRLFFVRSSSVSRFLSRVCWNKVFDLKFFLITSNWLNKSHRFLDVKFYQAFFNYNFDIHTYTYLYIYLYIYIYVQNASRNCNSIESDYVNHAYRNHGNELLPISYTVPQTDHNCNNNNRTAY